MRHTALLIVDVQNDFCEGGSLEVKGGAEVALKISDLLHIAKDEYDLVVASLDFHVDPGSHFGDTPDYKDSWPRHCVAGTHGVALHNDLDIEYIDEFFRKGHYSSGYSAFDGISVNYEGLHNYLQSHNIQAVEVCGIATDYCVLHSALSARYLGYRVKLLSDFSVGVAAETTDKAIDTMRREGIRII